MDAVKVISYVFFPMKLCSHLHLDIKVDVTTSSRSIDHCEAESIGTALGNAIGESGLLVLGCLLNLAGVEVAELELRVQLIQLNTRDDIERINDVAQTLGHLAALGVTDQTVAEDLTEGDLASHLQAKHDHASNPEEQNIPASLQNGCGEQRLQVVGLLGPTEGAEGPETRGKPSC